MTRLVATTALLAACAGTQASAPPTTSVPLTAARPTVTPPVDGAPRPDFRAIRDARLARRRDAILAAPRCPPQALVDTTAWVQALGGDTTMGLKVPKEFIRDAAFDWIHGGAQWRAGDRTLLVENGWWAPSSERDRNAPSCRVTVGTGDYIVDETRTGDAYDWMAMPADTVWRMTMQIGAHSPRREDRSLFLTALATLHWGRR